MWCFFVLLNQNGNHICRYFAILYEVFFSPVLLVLLVVLFVLPTLTFQIPWQYVITLSRLANHWCHAHYFVNAPLSIKSHANSAHKIKQIQNNTTTLVRNKISVVRILHEIGATIHKLCIVFLCNTSNPIFVSSAKPQFSTFSFLFCFFRPISDRLAYVHEHFFLSIHMILFKCGTINLLSVISIFLYCYWFLFGCRYFLNIT